MLPSRFSKTGKRTALYFNTRSEAKDEQIRLQAKLSDGVIAQEASLTSSQLEDINKAYGLIAESGAALTLADAVTIALERRRATLKGIEVAELLERYEAAVADPRHWSDKQRMNWRFYARKLSNGFGHVNIAELGPHALRDWLSSNFESAVYFNSAMSVLGPAFTWAAKQDIIDQSPFERIERRRVIRKDAIDVFTVDEAQRLLACCAVFKADAEHPMANEDGVADKLYKLDCRDAALPFAFLLFAGIRPEELAKLTWDDVRAEEGYIHITPSVAKTNQVRHVAIMDNLAAWIATTPKKRRTGSIVPKNWKRKAYLVRKAAGLLNRHDTARHSFASYFLALTGDLNKLRENMGHVRDSDMLFKHYRAAVTKQNAAAYFGIKPPN